MSKFMATTLKQLGFNSYEAYLDSTHWIDFKARYRESGRRMRCVVCRKTRRGETIQLHHTTYDRLGREEFSDVIPLCGDHHRAVHRWLSESGMDFVEHTNLAVAHLIATIEEGRNTRANNKRIKRMEKMQEAQKVQRRAEAIPNKTTQQESVALTPEKIFAGRSARGGWNKPPDAKWLKMKAAWDACEKAGVDPPEAVLDFFGDDEPDALGVIVGEAALKKCGALTNPDPPGEATENRWEIDITKLPKGVSIIRFTNSY